jgi:hypothetical protein
MAEQAPPPAAPATQTLYDDKGNAVEVPVDQTAQALSQGLGFAPGQRVLVADADGKVQDLDAEQAIGFFGSLGGLGGRGATADELQEQTDKATYGGALGTVGAGAAGLARGATLGLSDVAISELGGREQLAKLERYNPTASTVGEVAGSLAPALLSGGASAPESAAALGARAAVAEGGALARGAGAAARLVSAPARAAEALGAAAERGLARGLGAESLGARLASGAAAPMVEGAIGAVGSEVSRAYIDDSPLTADRLLAAGGAGLLLGGAAGGAFGLAGEGVAAGGRALGRAVEGGTKLAVAGVEDLGGKAYSLVQDVAGAGRALGGGLVKRAEDAAPGLAGKGRELVAKGRELLDEGVSKAKGLLDETGTGGGPLLDDLATRKALTSTGANARKLDELAERGDETVKRVADRLHNEIPKMGGKGSLAEMSRAEISAAATKGRKAAGAGIGDYLDELDDTAQRLEARAPTGKPPNVRPNVKKIAREVERDVVKPLDAEVFRSGQAKKLREMVADFAEKSDGLSIKDVHAIRAKLDDVIFESQVSGARPLEDAYRKFRGIIEKEIENTEGRIVKYGELPETYFGQYKRLKQNYADYVWLDEAANAGAWRQAANRSFGLSEQFGLLGGLALGGAPGALFGAVVQSFARRYGDQIVATWANRAGRMGAFEATTSIIDDAIGDSLRKFFRLPETRQLADVGRAALTRAGDLAKTAGQKAGALAAKGGEVIAEGGKRAKAATLRGAEGANRALAEAGGAGARGVRALGRGTERGVVAGELGDREPEPPPRERYKALRAQVREAQRTLPARAAGAIPDVRAANPALADRMVSKTQSIADNIAAEMAKVDPPKGATSEWSGRESTPSDWDAMGVLSYAKGALEPLEVCLDLADGTVDHDAIRGLRENAPDLYADLQRQAVELAAQHYDDLPYERRVALGVLLDVPTDDTLQGDFIGVLQSSYAELDAQTASQNDMQGPPPGSAPNLSGAMFPESQQSREM